ncbi:MAG: LacI family DNA-binding transcriptional regulator [Bifidobacterium mongoliense]|jgi:LacI family sucrose operon transcriptional repressor|uniref:LacI family DNA-binding transcriptional regulator n=1 Tax=Bifidobacterium mongoliense TaxID=518643 RepID=UPI002F3552A6
MVGMRDVAKRAGASLSTVSLVVNGNGYVSSEMRGRIERAMADLDYIPNELARNLYHGRTGIIGMIVPTIRHPFFATLTAAVQRALSDKGLRTLLCSTADAGHGEAEYVDMLRRHMMDGIIMAAHTTHGKDYWTSIGRPVVAFDRYLGPRIPVVRADHRQEGELVADLLLRTGARHVAAIGGPREQFHDWSGRLPEGIADTGRSALDTTFPTVGRYLQLERRLDAEGVRSEYLEAGDVDDFAGYARAAHEVFERYPDVDAIVAPDVGAAYGVQEALARGVRIPHDVQVVAYDGTYMTRTAGLRLTAVQQDFDAMASMMGHRMMEAIDADAARRVPSTPSTTPPPATASLSGPGPGPGPVVGVPAALTASGVGDPVREDVIPVTMVPGLTTR